MEKKKKHEYIWVPNPNPDYNIKIANKEAVAENYTNKSKDYADVETGDVACCDKECTKFPQTVCKECLEYVCEDHVYRHPKCEEGK